MPVDLNQEVYVVEAPCFEYINVFTKTNQDLL